jgi:ribonuclease HI
MEILAAIRGLEALKRACTVTLYSDSRYLVDCMEKGWARRWRARNWMRTKQEAAKNPDLLGRLLDLCEQHRVCFRWVRGHAGHAENERCDRLATEALKRKDLAEDEGYTRASGGGAASAWRNP